jgi:hypothetical protein
LLNKFLDQQILLKFCAIKVLSFVFAENLKAKVKRIVLQNIELQNVELQNVELQNVENTNRRITKRRLQNVKSYKR